MENIQYLIEIYQSQIWASRALLAAIMVGIMCGVLGCFIVLRNMSLIGDALAHAVLPGVVFAYIAVQLIGGYFLCSGIVGEDCRDVLKPWYPFGFFIGSILAALLTSVIITWIQRNVRTENDAAIGIVFTTMFALGVIGISELSKNQSVHLDLKDMLFGNILGVSNSDLWITSIVALGIISSIFIFYKQLLITTFQEEVAKTMGIKTHLIHYYLMLILSFAVVASLRTVGVILVVAMLIIPAATSLLLSDKLNKVIIISGIIGFLASFIGMNLAILFDTTPGPLIVVVATTFYFLAVFLSPKKGLLIQQIRQRKLST